MAPRSTPAEFLRVPPFPGARVHSLIHLDHTGSGTAPDLVDPLLEKIRELRVGGTYWARQPTLPERYCLVRVRDPDERRRQAEALGARLPIVEWIEPDWPKPQTPAAFEVVGPCDPWHMVDGAESLTVDVADEVAVIAMLRDIPVASVGRPRQSDAARKSLHAFLGRAAATPYRDPFTGEPMDFAAAIELCGSWRQLIDSNRSIDALAGFAMWKRGTVSPLLWRGTEAAPFVTHPDANAREVAVWRSKAEPEALEAMERRGTRLVEVEDGFIRSAGLGADCVPPLSIVVDRLGIYFDPSRPSDLEQILEHGQFPVDLVRRAAALRARIVESGITKYAVGERPFQRTETGKSYILAVGQVDDDRAVVMGGGPANNREFLRRVREGSPNAHIIYKPHPDVEAGHRRGAIADDEIVSIADEVVRDFPISSLISSVDAVHVNTSLAGFEALMRGKPVFTYGVPFYAGWGLTDDRGPVPPRRTARRTVDELVAATLLLYARYIDPVTGLPCLAEVLVSRLSENEGNRPSPIIKLRRFQGRMNRVVAAVRSRL